jgi:hypothetical protein
VRLKVRLNIETTQSVVGPLVKQTEELEKTFAIIDSLEEFMNKIDATVTQAEERTAAIEQNYSTISKTKRMLSSLYSYK